MKLCHISFTQTVNLHIIFSGLIQIWSYNLCQNMNILNNSVQSAS